MKIQEISNPALGKAFDRISLAFHKHFPNVEWTDQNPDIKTIQLLGQGEVDLLNKMDRLDNVILFQMNFHTSGVSAEVWQELWKKCKLVISFHDLKSYYPDLEFNFYRTALGAEPEEFPVNLSIPRDNKVFSTGHVAETEGLDLIYEACKKTNNIMFHTGENFHWGSNYHFIPYMSNAMFSKSLQTVQYVPGLRFIEGFELMCIEGAMTGAVPIVPNLPTYDFYKDFGIYIDTNKNIVEQLVNIFDSEYKPLSIEQINYVRNIFSWDRICSEIYKRL
jgi:hypothetical protein